MRTTIGILIGVAVGLAAGVAATTYWNSQGVTVLTKANREDATSELYLLCQSSMGGKESPLIIKSSGNVAKSMVFSWNSPTDAFNIEETNDFHYIAYRRSPDDPDAYATIDFNRGTGEFAIANKVSAASRELLVSICEKRIPGNECEARLKQTKGAGRSDCFYIYDEITCGRMKNIGMSAISRYQCHPSDKRFYR